jgi:hypothetical protein
LQSKFFFPPKFLLLRKFQKYQKKIGGIENYFANEIILRTTAKMQKNLELEPNTTCHKTIMDFWSEFSANLILEILEFSNLLKFMVVSFKIPNSLEIAKIPSLNYPTVEKKHFFFSKLWNFWTGHPMWVSPFDEMLAIK